ncbi:hypothetical protein [Metabacillus fastidiosus]|uniref:DUF4376 domain-containing protein n=1 Tax=Metabacillus fastidiosus TaxID=1458 RepID=UPI003D2CBF47
MIGVLFTQSDKKINQIVDNVTKISPSKLEFKGGYLEGYDESEIGAFVTDQGEFTVENNIPSIHLKNDIKVNIGDIIPSDWIDYSGNFREVNKDKLILQIQEQLMTSHDRYLNIDKTSISLEELKAAKIDQLSYFCEQDILSGFTSTLNGHRYRTNRDDQTNLLGKFNQLMNDETIIKVMWKTEDVGYVEHTRDDWLSIYYEALHSKETKLFKYDQLKKLVSSKTTNQEVDSVVW